MTTIALPSRQAQPHEAQEFSDWQERSIQHLLQRSGHAVQREPHIMGKTPDLLALPATGDPFIVECIARIQDPEHALELTENGWHICHGNIRELHHNVWSRLDHKATKYREIAQTTTMPYVIALHDATCANDIDTAVDLVLSPFAPTLQISPDGVITNKKYDRLWHTPDIPAALFELYPHLSGFLYSRWPDQHHYLPNPHATHPLHADHFPFAQVPQLPSRYNLNDWRPQPATMRDDFDPPPQPWREQLRLLNHNRHRLR